MPSKMKYAIVINEKYPEVFSYLKTVAQFKGVVIEIFASHDKGREWLNGKTILA